MSAARAHRAWPIAGLVLGALFVLAGLALVVAYFAEAVVARAGEPDQSLLFWYLPILFIGIVAVALGVASGFLGFLGLRRQG